MLQKKLVIHPAFKSSTMQKNFKCISTAIVCLLIIQARAQAPLMEIENQFDHHRQNNLQEKIYVHTDKNNYVPGEICWFKIYNVDAYFNKPINLGKVAYVEVLDKNNKAVLQAKIALEKGFGDGSLYLPATLVSGNYLMRAYTNWMKNFGPGYFFEKKLQIINVQKEQPQNVVAQKPAYDIAFFPEGGNLVNGIQSRVGCKVVNNLGKGVNFEGILLNDKGDSLAIFRPLVFGMGSFSFTPLAGLAYRALIKLPGGEQQLKELPAAYNDGYIMQLERTGQEQIKVTVQTSARNAANTSAVYLFVHTRNVIKAVVSNTLQNGQAVFTLPATKPGDGISHFTIFNEARRPVCERLYFKKPVSTLQITAKADQPNYTSRKKINIDIAAVTEAGKSVAANLSMAVYRLDSLNGIDGQDITNYLLMSADLQGNIESPGYYFNQNNSFADAAADNLMLTQGWRRFVWDDILTNKKPAFQFVPEVNGHIVNGKITALQPGLPLKEIPAYLSVPGIRTQFQTAGSDASGKVKFEMKNFYSDGDIIAQTNNEKDSGYRLELAPPFFPAYSNNILPPFDLKGHDEALLKMYIASQVRNAYLYNQLNHSTLPALDTSAFYLKPDVIYLLDNYVRFTTLEEVLREYVLEVNVRLHGGKFHLPVLDAFNRGPFASGPLILLDGVPMFDFNKLMKYDPLKIRKLEVVTKTYFLGTNSFDGIVNLITYKGNLEGFEIDPRATIVDYEGLQLQRDFYSPVYETPQQIQSRIPDYRTLLYWAPNLITNKEGKVQTGFYSADLPGRYAIVTQGLTEDGRTGTTVAGFEVK
ncbi:MAG: hypothetical protein JWP81_1163 [Ferruginibacter sp.]|nr:hypothetical protein [Ferruginibacter sp.]